MDGLARLGRVDAEAGARRRVAVPKRRAGAVLRTQPGPGGAGARRVRRQARLIGAAAAQIQRQVHAARRRG